ncbi:MAG: cell wall hydrolase [Eubacteriales bacterium]|nr:cell wall hydrolase [Eubacteriales bacterium]
MFQKYAAVMAAFSLLLAAAWFCVRGGQINRYVAENAFVTEPLTCVEEMLDYEKVRETGQTDTVQSVQPVIDVNVLEKEPLYQLTREDYVTLLKIVEAEAGSEDETGKLLVANVVLNRVKSDQFPDTVTEVVYQRSGKKAQFSPVGNGSIETIQASEETVEAVERALNGEDISQGALYFAARSAADPQNMNWFDECLTRLFSYGGHEFFE